MIIILAATEFEFDFILPKAQSQRVLAGMHYYELGEGVSLLISGPGIVNAALIGGALAQLDLPRETVLLNLGIAGDLSQTLAKGSLHIPDGFTLLADGHQGMMSSLLKKSYPEIEQNKLGAKQLLSVVTPIHGDLQAKELFAQGHHLVDMEAYAYARAGESLEYDFLSVKAISDHCNSASREVFLAGAQLAKTSLARLLQDILSYSDKLPVELDQRRHWLRALVQGDKIQ